MRWLKTTMRLGSPKPDHNFQNWFSVLEAVKTGFPVLVRFWHFSSVITPLFALKMHPLDFIGLLWS